MSNFLKFTRNFKRRKIYALLFGLILLFPLVSTTSAAGGVGADCTTSTDPDKGCTSPLFCHPDTKKCTAVSSPATSASNLLTNVVGWFATEAITGAILTVAFVVITLVGYLLSWAAWFVDFALAVNGEVLNLPVVQLGWRIVRDMANLFFVLGIIVVAFATVIRNETYGIKKTLFKLIVMAVLINFSLSISGAILDSSAILTNFFISKATNGDPHNVSKAMGQAFGPQTLLNVQASAAETAKQKGAKILEAIASLFFIIIFSWMGVISFFALGAMLFIRFIHISFLLILAPLAWLGWVFPGLSIGGQGNFFKTWWNEFLRWTFFAPAMAFFLYLALFAIQQQASIKTLANSTQSGAALGGALNIGSGTGTTPGLVSLAATIGSMFVFCGLMMGGLLTANKMGIQGATTATNYAKKASSYLGGKARGAAKGTGKWAGRRFMAQGTLTDQQGGTTTRLQRAGTAFSNFLAPIPVLRRAGRYAAGGVNRLATSALEETKKIQKDKFSKERITNAGLLKLLQKPEGLNYHERAAVASEAAERKMFAARDNTPAKNLILSPGQLDPFIEAATRMGTLPDIEKKVLSESPELHDRFKSHDTATIGLAMTEEEVMRRHGTSGKAPDYSNEALNDVMIVKEMNENYIFKMASDGSGGKQKILVETAERGLGTTIADRLKRLLEEQEVTTDKLKDLEEKGDQRTTAEQAELDTLQVNRRSLKTEEKSIMDDPNTGSFAKLLKAAIKSPPMARFVTP